MKILGLNLFTLLLLGSNSLGAEPKVNVRIGKSLKKIILSGSDVKQIIKGNLKHKVYPGRKKIRFN